MTSSVWKTDTDDAENDLGSRIEGISDLFGDIRISENKSEIRSIRNPKSTGSLEGNVVVGDGGGAGHRVLITAAVAAVLGLTPAAATAAEQHDLVGLHFGRVVLLAFFFPLPRLEPAFELDLLALDQVRLQRIRGLAPQHDAVPLGLFFLLAFFRRPVLGGRNAEARHRLTARRDANLRVLAQISHQNHFVHATHVTSPFVYVFPVLGIWVC